MDDDTFSVLLNDTVRIDGLSIRQAKKCSGTLRALFCFEDAEEVRAARTGQPVALNVPCTDETLLRWIFSRLQGLCYEIPPHLSPRQYGQVIATLSFLEIEHYETPLTCAVLQNHHLVEVLDVLKPLYPTLNETFQKNIVDVLCKDLSRRCFYTYKCSETPIPPPPCRVLIVAVLTGADFSAVLDETYRWILDEHHQESFCRFGEKDIILAKERVNWDLIKNMLPLGENCHLAFVFDSPSGKEATPIGWVTFTPSSSFDYISRRFIKREGEHRTMGASRKILYPWDRFRNWTDGIDRITWLAPFRVDNTNVYEDKDFVRSVLESLDTTLDEIREWLAQDILEHFL